MSSRDEQRQERVRARTRTGRYGENRESWVDLALLEAVLYIGPTDNEFDQTDFPEEVDSVRLLLAKKGTKLKIGLPLTHMTEDEVEVFREFMNRALDLAQTKCRELDQKARQAFDQGDDTYARLYRPVPRLVVRSRIVTADGSGVPQRSDQPEPVAGRSAGIAATLQGDHGGSEEAGS
jgi:hypothetical protein